MIAGRLVEAATTAIFKPNDIWAAAYLVQVVQKKIIKIEEVTDSGRRFIRKIVDETLNLRKFITAYRKD